MSVGHAGVRRMPAGRTAGAPSRGVLDRALREIHAGPAWHGPSVKDALRGVSASDAGRAPGPGRNSIWEIVLHMAYARHRVIGRLSPGKRPRFPRPLRSSWWPRMPAERDQRAWKADLALLDETHLALRDTVARVPARVLAGRRTSQRRTRAEEVLGVAFHDAYHAGQIRLVRRLLEAGAGR